jgi:hypothetical protein
MNESILKIDRCGRLRYTPEQKKTMVDAFLTSGLSAPRFASLHGVNYQTLVSWIKKGKSIESEAPSYSLHPAVLSLIPAEVDHAPAIDAGRAMEVLLHGGEKLFISSPDQIELAATLIRALKNSRPC